MQVQKRNALSEILILTGLCLLGMFVFSAAGLYLFSAMFGFTMEELSSALGSAASFPEMRMPILLLQGLIAAGSFILFPWLMRFIRPEAEHINGINPGFSILALIAGLSVLMMPVNAWLAAWNQSIRLPSFLQGFQSWAWEKEQEMEKLTAFLTSFSGNGEMLAGFVVIALVAGISEEFFFRKMIQPRIIALTGNPHLGIWLTAFIFSAIHMQFYGLVPRMVLGALFGYYFFWTGNIWLSMLAHSLNNGLTLLGFILYQQKISPVNVENPEVIPWYLGAVSAGIVWGLAVILKDEARKLSLAAGKTKEPVLP